MVPDQDGLVPVPHDLPHFPHKVSTLFFRKTSDRLLDVTVFYSLCVTFKLIVEHLF